MPRLRTSLALAAALVAACDDRAPVAPPTAPDASASTTTPAGGAQRPATTPSSTTPSATPTDTSRGGTPGGTPATPPPSTTPRDSVALTISASSLTLAPGGTATLSVRMLSNGTWSSPSVAYSTANPAVATVSAAGVVTGVAVGTTTLRAAVGERWLQIAVTVTADGRPRVPTDSVPTRPPSDTAGRGPTTPPAYVSEFTLGGRVFDATPGPDSASYRPIAGATVTLVALRDAQNQPIAPERVAGTATTDARGAFTLPKAPGGWYRLDVTPPSGSGFGFVSILVSRPVQAELRYDVALRRQP